MNIWAELMRVRRLHLSIWYKGLFVMEVEAVLRNSPGSRLPGRNRKHRVEARLFQEFGECGGYYRDVQHKVEDGELVL